MEEGRWRVHAVLTFTQITFGISYILNKVALNNGMNKFVFSIYRDVIAIVFLAILAFAIERSQRTRITLKTAALIFLLGLVGIFGAQILMLTGLSLTSAAFTSIFQSCTPVFAFLISIIFGLEKIHYSRHDGRAKLLGVFFCISGTFVAALFKGRPLIGTTEQDSHVIPSLQGYSISTWQLGALCLFANSLCMAVFINLQAPVLKRYPAPISLTAWSYFTGAVILAIVGAFVVNDSSSWIVTRPMDAVAFIYAGIVTSGLNFGLQTWSVHKAGPFLAISYFPLQAIVSTFLSCIFLQDPLYLGSIIGGILIVSGLYLVTWGQAQQLKLDKMVDLLSSAYHPDSQPLLQSESVV